ncbi:acetyl-CoA synthetase-like protein [Linderina pennispora]|uniref:Acetyl-CoA synthetase-like protein n=1 Tax=Linderina pennispora TaxID=61395 RepID=A0A1Y1VX42_9FUNG|nr:acetyl-CoA synthetase-like protein [Linderina pennispora]ORX65869.1 acetyl-CoA synthetase-like protein [Linderina pennispora]
MPFTSSHPSINVPAVDLPTFFFETVKSKTMERHTTQIASGLANNAGLVRGDTLLVVLPNTVYYSAITLGVQMLGAMVTTANPLYTVRELANHITLSGARMVVTTNEKLADIKAAVKHAEAAIAECHVFTIDGENSIFDILCTDAFPQIYINTEEEASRTIAAIVFSSGTGGKPKGIMLSHRNIVANIVQNMAAFDSDKPLCARMAATDGVPHMIAITPFFHIYGFTCHLHLHLCQGFAVVEPFCQLVQKYRARTAHITAAVRKYDLSSIVYVTSGAAPLTKELHLEAQRTLGFPVIQDYGMSETSPAGRLLPNITAKVVNDQDAEVEQGQVGELCVRGPNIMLGYLNNPTATAESFDSEGYLHTGDIGYINSSGNVFITDRKKELIKYKGFQACLIDHPAVLDCAVIGVYDEKQATELPKGYIVVRPEADKSAVIDDIQEWLSTRLRGGIELVDAIPKSPTGKILRRVLRDRELCKCKGEVMDQLTSP